MDNTSFSQRIADTVFAAYAALPKRGKAQGHEWTMLAGIVASHKTDTASGISFWPVTVSTGAKCLGQCDMRCDGLVINDSHAEVLSRRALKLALLHEVSAHNRHCGGKAKCTLRNPLLIHSVDVASKRFQFRQRHGVTLHLYISDQPCGDATIYNDPGISVSELGSAPASSSVDPADSRLETSDFGEGFRRTGAKLALHARTIAESAAPEPDGFSPRFDDHARSQASEAGSLRTKAGRSDLPPSKRTLSMSCSDKIGRWIGCGVSGALVSHWLEEPIFLSSVVVSAEGHSPGTPLAPRLSALHRALIGRGRCACSSAWKAAGLEDDPNEGAAPSVAADTPPAIVETPDCAIVPATGRWPMLAVIAKSFSDGKAATLVRASPGQNPAAAGEKRKREEGDTVKTVKHVSQAELSTSASAQQPDAKPPKAGGTGSGAAVVPCPTSLNAVSHSWDPADGAPDYGAGKDPISGLPTVSIKRAGLPSVIMSVECTNAATGTLAGSTKKTPPDAAASRLCKSRMAKMFAEAAPDVTTASGLTYYGRKHASSQVSPGITRYCTAVAAFHAPGGGYEGWLYGKPELEAFSVAVVDPMSNPDPSSSK